MRTRFSIRLATLLLLPMLAAEGVSVSAQNASQMPPPPAIPAGPLTPTAPPPPAPMAQGGQGAAQTYTLRYKFVAGQIRNYETTIDVTGSLGGGGASFPYSQHVKLLTSQIVQSVRSDGVATIATRMIAAEVTVNGHTTAYDDAQIQQMQAGIPTVVLGPTGRVISTSGGAAARGPAGDPTAYMRFSLAALLPDNPVRIGGAWRGSIEALGLQFFTRSVLKQVTSGVSGDQTAHIATTYYGATNASGMTVPNTGRLYILMTGNGRSEFDNTTGTITHLTSDMQTKLTIEPSQTGRPAGAAQQPVKTHLSVRMDVTLIGNGSGA